MYGDVAEETTVPDPAVSGAGPHSIEYVVPVEPLAKVSVAEVVVVTAVTAGATHIVGAVSKMVRPLSGATVAVNGKLFADEYVAYVVGVVVQEVPPRANIAPLELIPSVGLYDVPVYAVLVFP